MDDQAKKQQVAADDQKFGQSPIASVQKELEPIPSVSADFSELEEMPAEKVAESEPGVHENSTGAGQLGGGNASSAYQPQIQSVVAVSQTAQSSHIQHIMTKEQAQKIVKGPLIFKNSSDPMLWLAFILLRHYQLLAEEEKKESLSH